MGHLFGKTQRVLCNTGTSLFGLVPLFVYAEKSVGELAEADAAEIERRRELLLDVIVHQLDDGIMDNSLEAASIRFPTDKRALAAMGISTGEWKMFYPGGNSR